MKEFFKKIDFKYILKIIILTILIGSLFSVFIMTNMSTYEMLDKPINVPPIVFGIVWTILYILMSIAYYIISKSNNIDKKNALLLYWIQLGVNSVWTLIFFGLNAYLFAFIWLVLLIILVCVMIAKFFNINKISAYILIPYLIWILFAAYLNYGIYYLNK